MCSVPKIILTFSYIIWVLHAMLKSLHIKISHNWSTLHGRNEPAFNCTPGTCFWHQKHSICISKKSLFLCILMRAKWRGGSTLVPLFAPRCYLSLPCQINLPPVKLNDIYSGAAIWQLGLTHSQDLAHAARRLGKRWWVRCAAGCLHLESGGESDDCLLGPRLIIMYNDSCQGWW